MTDLRKRLAEGPGSRELSDEVLLAMGWTLKELGRVGGTYPASVAINPDGQRVPKPHVSVVTDDALALVPEGLTYDVDATAPEAGVDFGLHTKGEFDRVSKGTAYGENPLPRAICLAVLGAKDG